MRQIVLFVRINAVINDRSMNQLTIPELVLSLLALNIFESLSVLSA